MSAAPPETAPLDTAPDLPGSATAGSDDERPCAGCGSLMDLEDLFCSVCGREAPGAAAGASVLHAPSIVNFKCERCGAVMTFSATAQALSCAFCGSARLHQDLRARTVLPRLVVPFRLGRGEVLDRFRAWLGSSIWRPGDLAASAAVQDFRGVYLPHWVFSCDVQTHWCADHDRVPPGHRGEWAPAWGERADHYEGLVVAASAALTQAEAEALAPYDFEHARSFSPDSLADFPMEDFGVARKTARAIARSRIIAMEHARCAQEVPGRRHRNLHINPLVENMTSMPGLLPAWVMAYEYRGKVYRFLLNGQTGEPFGTAPLSWARIGGTIAAAVLLLALIILLLGR